MGTQIQSPTTTGGISRLSLMQERFRQKMMLEKESQVDRIAAAKRAQDDDRIQRVTKTSASSLSSSMSSLNSSYSGQGRVRRMFEERRTNPIPNNRYGHSPKGIDKSYPLEPVKKEYGRPPTKGLVKNGANRGVSMERGNGGYVNRNEDPGAGMTRSRSQVNMQQQRANRGDNRLQKPPRGPAAGSQNSRLPTHHKSTSSLLDRNYNNGPSRGPSPAPPSSTKSSPGPRGPPVPPSRKNAPRDSFLKVNKGPAPRSRSPSPSPATRNAKPPESESKGFFAKLGFGGGSQKKAAAPQKTPAKQLPPRTQKSFNNKENRTPAPPPANSNLRQCKVCQRSFAQDRIQKHEEICKKTKQKQKKRKVFDPVKMRTSGTEAENFVAGNRHLKDDKAAKKIKDRKNQWRKKHEDFISTIRAAKGIQGYVAPPLDTSDYVQCPHCGRKFNSTAADRHIPKCTSINKPPPNQGFVKRR